MNFTEINSSGKRGELLGRIDRQNYRFRTAKTIIIKFGLHASFVELESAKNAVNEVDEFSNQRLKEMSFGEQTMNIKSYVRLRKSDTETYEVLKHVYGSNMGSQTQTFELHRCLEKTGKESKMTNALHVRRFPASLKTSKQF
ncbi:hypothetical protein TNCV_581311 [Trichonephila clavipes]|nr:hypothetical protein TNCV_581311 [Trichonephila clavipes]